MNHFRRITIVAAAATVAAPALLISAGDASAKPARAGSYATKIKGTVVTNGNKQKATTSDFRVTASGKTRTYITDDITTVATKTSKGSALKSVTVNTLGLVYTANSNALRYPKKLSKGTAWKWTATAPDGSKAKASNKVLGKATVKVAGKKQTVWRVKEAWKLTGTISGTRSSVVSYSLKRDLPLRVVMDQDFNVLGGTYIIKSDYTQWLTSVTPS